MKLYVLADLYHPPQLREATEADLAEVGYIPRPKTFPESMTVEDWRALLYQAEEKVAREWIKKRGAFDSWAEAMKLCRLNPDDAAYWERGMLCPFHTGVEEGMWVVLEWLNRESEIP